MKIGQMAAVAGGSITLDSVLKQVEQAEAQGFESIWVPSVRTFDALILLALAGRQTSRITLGTFVVPTYPRHPAALAEQALTAQVASGGRLVLGIGLSHRRSMEGMLGFDW